MWNKTVENNTKTIEEILSIIMGRKQKEIQQYQVKKTSTWKKKDYVL